MIDSNFNPDEMKGKPVYDDQGNLIGKIISAELLEGGNTGFSLQVDGSCVLKEMPNDYSPFSDESIEALNEIQDELLGRAKDRKKKAFASLASALSNVVALGVEHSQDTTLGQLIQSDDLTEHPQGMPYGSPEYDARVMNTQHKMAIESFSSLTYLGHCAIAMAKQLLLEMKADIAAYEAELRKQQNEPAYTPLGEIACESESLQAMQDLLDNDARQLKAVMRTLQVKLQTLQRLMRPKGLSFGIHEGDDQTWRLKVDTNRNPEGLAKFCQGENYELNQALINFREQLMNIMNHTAVQQNRLPKLRAIADEIMNHRGRNGLLIHGIEHYLQSPVMQDHAAFIQSQRIDNSFINHPRVMGRSSDIVPLPPIEGAIEIRYSGLQRQIGIDPSESLRRELDQIRVRSMPMPSIELTSAFMYEYFLNRTLDPSGNPRRKVPQHIQGPPGIPGTIGGAIVRHMEYYSFYDYGLNQRICLFIDLEECFSPHLLEHLERTIPHELHHYIKRTGTGLAFIRFRDRDRDRTGAEPGNYGIIYSGRHGHNFLQSSVTERAFDLCRAPEAHRWDFCLTKSAMTTTTRLDTYTPGDVVSCSGYFDLPDDASHYPGRPIYMSHEYGVMSLVDVRWLIDSGNLRGDRHCPAFRR